MLLEGAERSAEVSAVEAEGVGDFAGGGSVAVGEFVEDAGVGERVIAAEVAFAEGADAAGIEAVEFADGVGAAGRDARLLAVAPALSR